jgi:flagellar motility protein MotE (MotC chaperone)
MAGMPRLLPLVAIAIGGVLAVNAVRGAPNLIGAAKSFAEDSLSSKAGPAINPTATIGGVTPVSNGGAAAPACAPSAAELAKEAGLSPAELQVLQSLGNRRGELDQREQSLDTQVQLIAAAEAKLDSRIKDMNSLKQNIQDLLGQADAQQNAETDRLITVYEKMKPKDAAARMTLMDDSVRLPMAAKMKPAALALILAQMPPEDAKNLTEKLAQRVSGSQAVASAQAALNPPPAATPANNNAQSKAAPTQTAANAPSTTPSATPSATASAKDQATPAAKPVRTAKAKPRPKPKATPKTAVASNDKSSAVATGDTSAKTPPSAAPSAKPTGSTPTPTPGASPGATPATGKTG